MIALRQSRKGYFVLFLVLIPGDHTLVMSDHFSDDDSTLDITVNLHVGRFPW
jgi:hypothetical protein